MKQVFDKNDHSPKKSTKTTFFLQLTFVAYSFLLVTAREIGARRV